ncbi:UNVERIFIED_ORG: hypothetical protein J2W85_005394 [Ensifer adhaerens]|nr:hypothetical protein [Ensifer adhaerens]
MTDLFSSSSMSQHVLTYGFVFPQILALLQSNSPQFPFDI